MTEAKIILDSISPEGHRLTTMEVTFHRFVLAEFNTHRMFSRNSASSRAIPVKKQIERIRENPAIPVEFGTNQPGMQAGPPLEGHALETAILDWKAAAAQAVRWAEDLMEQGVHKQVANRLLEPFMWHTVIVTATEWDNFFGLRANPMAQPEIRVAAEMMLDAYKNSTPTRLEYGEWHTPYIQPEEYEEFNLDLRKQVSAARCARVSYLTHDGVRDVDKDLELFARLTEASPPHASPLEHVATPQLLAPPMDGPFAAAPVHLGNLIGWSQLRHLYWS